MVRLPPTVIVVVVAVVSAIVGAPPLLTTPVTVPTLVTCASAVEGARVATSPVASAVEKARRRRIEADERGWVMT